MSIALTLYEQLTEAGEDKTRAKLIAGAFETLWIVGSMGAILGFVRLLDWLLNSLPAR